MKLFIFKPILFLSVVIFQIGCNKDDLNTKPNKSLVVPTTITDFQALLDNKTVMNNTIPYLGELGSDNYYMVFNIWNNSSELIRNGHIWDKNVFPPATLISDWSAPYTQIFYCNVVLLGLQNIPNNLQDNSYENVKGSALFFRSSGFWWLAQEFCKAYNISSADSDLGLPLRVDPDLDLKVPRSSVTATYERIIKDLKEAETLLPDSAVVKTRPSKIAAQALLARVYLSMGDFGNALLYSDIVLKKYSFLQDFSSLPNTSTPFILYNKEVIHHAQFLGSSLFNTKTNCPVDTFLYKSYEANDLRKTLFFSTSNSLIIFKGSYTQSGISLFGGISVNEILLIRAESLARSGRVSEGMNDLNSLLRTRWKRNANGTTTLIDKTAIDVPDALNQILLERRKELIFRGLRWSDLRRLNQANANLIITRNLNGTVFSLNPNSSRYVYPIPIAELDLNPMIQNDRQ